MKPLAPAPVHYRLAPGGGLFLALAALLWALGGVLLAWLLALRQAQQAGAVLWVAVVMAYGAACVWSWRTARALPSGWLVWNGKLWQWQKTLTAVGQSKGQIGQTTSMPAFGVVGTAGIERAGLEAFETAGPPPVAAYAACTLMLDMQWAVLLRLHGPLGQGTGQGASQRALQSKRAGGFGSARAEAASGVWLWASRSSDPAHWHALRCALVWAQTQGVQAQDQAAGGALASGAGATKAAEMAQASQAIPAAGAANASQAEPAGRRGPAAGVSTWAAQPGQHRGAP